LNKIDEKKKEILSSENGTLTKVWNHKITVEKIEEKTVRYTDEIEIKAGLLTFFVWLFSHIFYRHRQRRWKQLLGFLS